MISRSNCANDSNTCSVSRPIGVLLLSCGVRYAGLLVAAGEQEDFLQFFACWP
jgi:hypothetical protein